MVALVYVLSSVQLVLMVYVLVANANLIDAQGKLSLTLFTYFACYDMSLGDNVRMSLFTAVTNLNLTRSDIPPKSKNSSLENLNE